MDEDGIVYCLTLLAASKYFYILIAVLSRLNRPAKHLPGIVRRLTT